MDLKTPLMLVTGGLGSGKTTLVRRILDNASCRIAVLMNEFGEIAIDSDVISGENVDIIELAGGCVCCSMTGELEAAVKEIIEKIKPDLILVEATGVAESDALVYEVEDLPGIRLDSVVCIIDAFVDAQYPYVGYASRTQIAWADIILINKIDLVSADEAATVESSVRRYNSHALLLKTAGCEVGTDLLFGTNTGPRPRHTEPGGATGFESFSWESNKKLDSDRFEEFARDLPPQVFRSKGFVILDNGSRLFNFVAGRSDFENFPAESNRLVFIGKDLDAVRDEILGKLRNCEMQRNFSGAG